MKDYTHFFILLIFRYLIEVKNLVHLSHTLCHYSALFIFRIMLGFFEIPLPSSDILLI
jgi:hypothetical protein